MPSRSELNDDFEVVDTVASDAEVLDSIRSKQDYACYRELILSMDSGVKDRRGDTLLTLALQYGDSLEDVRALIGKGVTLEAQNEAGWTALHLAVRIYHEAIPLLLQAQADPNIPNVDGDTPLHFAAKYTPDAVSSLLAAKADATLQNSKGWTPLHVAIVHHPELTDALIEAGADINGETRDDLTPLSLAVLRRPNLIQDLLKKGADLYRRDQRGQSVLNFARALKIPILT